MSTMQKYKITLLVAVAAFLPILWGAYPGMPLWLRVGIGLVLAALAGYVEHQKNVRPHLAIEEKRTYLFGYACDDAFAELRRFDPTARMNVVGIDPRLPGQEPVFKGFSRGTCNRVPHLVANASIEAGCRPALTKPPRTHSRFP